jgi:hypothetical protein
MQFAQRTFLSVALFLISTPSFQAQSPADPSGHWEGAVQIPDREQTFELDLVKNGQGEIGGMIHVPAGNVAGVPVKVTVKDGLVNFHARVDQPFSGQLSADGKSISGDYSLEGFVLPFSMSRTGNAKVEVPEKGAPIDRELEGTWNGMLELDGTRLRLVLAMRNLADGTSAGTIVSVDEGGLEVPLTITAQDSLGLALNLKPVGATYTGTWNRERRELAGTYRQGAFAGPLTFRKASAGN